MRRKHSLLFFGFFVLLDAIFQAAARPLAVFGAKRWHASIKFELRHGRGVRLRSLTHNLNVRLLLGLVGANEVP